MSDKAKIPATSRKHNTWPPPGKGGILLKYEFYISANSAMRSLSYIRMMQGTSQYNFVIRSYSRKCAILCWNVISRKMFYDSWSVNPSTHLHIRTGNDYNTSCWFYKWWLCGKEKDLLLILALNKRTQKRNPGAFFRDEFRYTVSGY